MLDYRPAGGKKNPPESPKDVIPSGKMQLTLT